MTAKGNATDLMHFISKKMRMSHIYQPVMIKALLENGGEATTEEIATSLLSYDQSQVEYYTLRTKNMVGKVLAKNGVVEPIKDGRQIIGYCLTEATHTDAQRAALKAMCDEAIDAYISNRGEAIWGHRGPDSGHVSGSTRYNALKRAKYRCELCGGHEDQVALHVDHIIPRSKGGPDDISNFQALCMTCNTNKRDTDDTDFSAQQFELFPASGTPSHVSSQSQSATA